jgi:hypothetical protein
VATRLRSGLALLGLVILAAGLAGMAGLIVATYGESNACAAWAMRLGLAGSLLASAAAQGLILLGGWTLWRALRQPPAVTSA